MNAAGSTFALRCAFAALASLLLALPVSVQGQMLGEAPPQQGATPPQNLLPPPPPPPNYAAPPAALNFDSVMTSGYSQSSFTFDRSMLQATDGFLAGGDSDTRRVIAGLNSITVHTYRARDVARYDPGALALIDGQLRGAGWKHLVNATAKGSGNQTDMWLHFDGPDITNVTVLTRGDRSMSTVAVNCSLRPLDLLHLSGHFGIPKVDESAVMVPAR